MKFFPGYSILLFAVLLGWNACQNPTPQLVPSPEPVAITSTEDIQKLVLTALKSAVEDSLAMPVLLETEYYKNTDDYAFVSCLATQPNGEAIDGTKTRYKDAAEAGVFSDSVFGLLKKEGGTWKVITTAIGPSDVPTVCWWKDYHVPTALFPEGMVAQECGE